MDELANRTIFLDTKVLQGGKLFRITHDGITRTARVIQWYMDYEKRQSRFNYFIDFCDNMTQKLFKLPGNVKSIALEYEFVEHEEPYHFSTLPILELINANQNNRQIVKLDPHNVKCLVIQQVGGSAYHVFPISLWFEAVPANQISVGKLIAPKPDENKQRLVINFNDVDVSQFSNRGTA